MKKVIFVLVSFPRVRRSFGKLWMKPWNMSQVWMYKNFASEPVIFTGLWTQTTI